MRHYFSHLKEKGQRSNLDNHHSLLEITYTTLFRPLSSCIPFVVSPFYHIIIISQRPDQTAVASVVVHTCKPHTLVEKAFNAELYEDAVELPIMKHGKVKVLEPGITLHTRMWTNGSGVSYVIKNDHDRPMRFTQDFSAGKNLLTHREAPKYERTIMPGHAKVLHHVTITEGSVSWQVSWRSSHTWL